MTTTKNESLPERASPADALRGLAAVIRKHGTCPPAALEHVAQQIDALTREAPTEGVVNDAAYIALQEILASHCNDNHRPKAFYIAARAIASIDTPPAPQRLAQGEVWTAEMVADVHRRGDELHQRITQPPHQDRGEVERHARDLLAKAYQNGGYALASQALLNGRTDSLDECAIEAITAALTEAKQQGPGEAVIDVLKQIMRAEGMEFREETK